MTFEEFFKKKRIDLAALQQGEPALFSEFKLHYEQMGEKSFDHTKKYWFNKVRRQYNLPPEVKTEKPKIENQLAEQTVNEELSEMAAPSPKVGFTPRFKAPAPPKPAEDTPEEKKEEAPPATPPKVGFTPRFKAGVTKPVEVPSEEKKAEEAPVEDKPKVGFTPRFKAGITKPAETPSEEKNEEAPIEDKPKIGFIPRFKAGVTKPAPPTPPEE
ncbi:MAG: hypothetical protein JWQ34_418 [Mucilaginibacter sp.]|uniref:hypothetical protein n=1 Tax=Mucilaginibacter sp. TaxID=1882438 RepID=UPI0026196B32|nr:hypothetical protein [Mucilaginibacter sp.]MDB5002193.1 hypothetical protein [Mucilaginibacter sp.]